MTEVTVAALQLALNSPDEGENIDAVAALVEEAARKGAQIILPPELFSGCYFCKAEDEALFALARPVSEHHSVLAMQAVAASQAGPTRKTWRSRPPRALRVRSTAPAEGTVSS